MVTDRNPLPDWSEVIAAKDAEIAVLRDQLWTAVWSDSEECKFLTAEVERLTAALERIAADDESDADLNEWGAAAVARAALKEPRT